ncbi:DUF2971 domain-containing protein [Bacillus toyonensis]|nr:DUF2971 domain-containing protein [Bacillus toyonensis]
MAYTPTTWKQTYKERTDLTGFLTHLTRPQPENNLEATDVLIKILREGTLQGSTKGYIVGNEKVICFQEAPIYSIAENAINHIEEYERYVQSTTNPYMKLRYYPCGLSLPKQVLYQLVDSVTRQVIPNIGVRPVIYEKTEIAKGFLPENEYWRIVDFELTGGNGITDWTHEREWRIKANYFKFPYGIVTVILRDSNQYQEFMSKIEPDIVKQLAGIVCLDKLLY